MSRLLIVSITISLLLLNAVIGNAQAQTLSLDEVLSLFYQRNLDLMAAQYNIDQARADEIIAGAIPNPVLGFQLGELSNNPNMGSSARGCNHNPAVSCGPAEYISFSQLIEIAGKRGLRMDSSGLATQAAESDFRDAIRIFSNMVRDAYYDLLQAQKKRWLAQEIVNQYQQIGQANQLRLKSGDIAEADFLKVKMEGLRAESDLDNAETGVKQARAALAVLLRWPEQSLQFEVAEDWPERHDLLKQDQRETDLIDQALRQRPDLLADKQRNEQAQKLLVLARRLKYPDVTVNAGYARDPSNNVLNSGFVGFSVPLPLLYQYQGESDKAAASLNQAQLAVEQTEIAIRNDVVSALAAWDNSNRIVARFQAGLLQDARQVRDSAELAFRKGASSVLELIDAQRSYKSVMSDYDSALINRANAYYDLLKALGSEANNQQTAGSVAKPMTPNQP